MPEGFKTFRFTTAALPPVTESCKHKVAPAPIERLPAHRSSPALGLGSKGDSDYAWAARNGEVSLPAAAWLFGSCLIELLCIARRKK